MKLPYCVSSLILSRKCKMKSIHTDDSHVIRSLQTKEGKQSSKSKCCTDKKSPILVFHSSKKTTLSVVKRLNFSLITMIVLFILHLFSNSIPTVECLKSPSFNRYFPYGVYNLQPQTIERNSRLFPNLPLLIPSIRDAIPSSTYSKSIRRASKLE